MYGSAVEVSERRLRLMEQKNVGCMMGLVTKFSGPGRLMVDYCAGKWAVRKVCLHLPGHWRHMGLKMEEDCAKEALPGLIKEYEKEVFSSGCESTAIEEIWDSVREFFCRDGWDTAPKVRRTTGVT